MPLLAVISAAVEGLPVALSIGGFALIALGMKLRFLWRVYEKGGREDLSAAADALRRNPSPGLSHDAD